MIWAMTLAGLALVGLYFSLRHAWWRPDLPLDWPRILMYHSISAHRPGDRYNRLRVSPEQFEWQLAWLVEHGWQTVTMSELVALPRPLPDKVVALTFDDGYADNAINALPLLQRYGCKATVYLVVERFSGDWAKDRDSGVAAPSLNREAMLDHGQVHALLDSGLVEIGAHTFSHADLRGLDPTDLEHELAGARRVIEAEYGQPCRAFAYPFGFFDTAAIRAVRDAGYTSAVTTVSGIAPLQRQDPMQLCRVMVSGRQGMLDFRLKMYKGRNR